jgi:N-acetylneuraminic acid mutarotase
VDGEWHRPILSGKAPPARGGHSVVLVGNLLVVFGGTFFGSGKFQYCKDVWVVDTDTMEWHQPRCAGRAPMARYGHTGVAVGTRIYYFGGRGESGALYNDVHCLDVARWAWEHVPSTTAPPLGRFGHASVAIEDKLVVWGGWDGRVAYNDLWVFDVGASSWGRPEVGGSAPTARHGHSMVLAPDGRLIIFGGWSPRPEGAPKYLSDTRVLDTAAMAWARSGTTGSAPSPRYAHGAAVVGDYMIVYGGWGDGQGKLTEEEARSTPEETMRRDAARADPAPRPHPALWALHLESMTWRAPVVRGGQPKLQYGHGTVSVGSFLLAFGGWDGVKPHNDLVQLNLTPLVGDLFATAEE